MAKPKGRRRGQKRPQTAVHRRLLARHKLKSTQDELRRLRRPGGRGTGMAVTPVIHEVGAMVLGGLALGGLALGAWALIFRKSPPSPAPTSVPSTPAPSPPTPRPTPNGGKLPDVVAAVQGGQADPYDWSEVAVGPYRVKVLNEPFSVGGLRLPTSFDDVVALAVFLDALPLTPAVSDARWAQAAHKATGGDGLGEPEKYNDADQVRRWAAKYPQAGVLSDGYWKEPVAVPGLAPGKLAQYGLRKTDGTPVQQGAPGPHNSAYKGYSLTGTLMKRAATKDGAAVDLLDVLAQDDPAVGGALPGWLVDRLRGGVA